MILCLAIALVLLGLLFLAGVIAIAVAREEIENAMMGDIEW